tara:strand:- start:2838 stop:5180 length:2343 start_codon:yes stop_codon:yes gene_type:complete
MADVKIDIPGIGEVTADNAASEKTLRDILKAIKGGAKFGGTGGGTGGLGGQAEETEKSLEGLEKQSEETTSALGSLSKGAMGLVGGAFNLLTSAIGSVVGAIPGFAGELLFGGNRISDFAKHVPILGGELQALSSAVEGQVDVFRELSTIGAGFGNNMFELASVAGRSAIPQEEFAQLLQSNSEGIRIFGNSIQDGARNFGRLSKELRQSSAGQDLMAMGFTTQELNENLISYSELTQLSGRRQFMSQQQLIEGSLEYSRELDKIAKLTGKSRKDIEAQQKAASLDIRRQMAIAEAGDNLRDRLSQVAAVSPELEAALVDMADGVANDPLTQQLMANNATFREQAANVQNMTAEQANNFMRSVADDGAKFAKTLGQSGVQASIAGGTATGEYLKIAGQLQKVQKTQEGTIDAEQAARDKMTAKVAQAEEALNNVKGRIIADIVDSGIFKKITDTIGDLIPSVEQMDSYYTKASTYFQSDILPKLKEVGAAMMKVDWGSYLDTITGWFSSLSTKAGEVGTGMIDKIKSMITGITGWWEEGGKEKFTKAMDDLTDFYNKHVKPVLDKILGGDFSGAFSDIGNLLKTLATSALKSMFSDFDWVSFGVSAAGLLVLTLTKLNPFGLVASTLISGIVGFIGWDNIKSFFSNFSLGEAIGNMWQKIKDGFSGLFNFDFKFPNFKSYLPKWLGGEGKSLSSLFSGGDSASQNTQTASVEKLKTESEAYKETTEMAENLKPKKAEEQVATNLEEAGANAINIQLAELIEVTKRSNKLISALNGNVMAG